jgi:hypothetical protein
MNAKQYAWIYMIDAGCANKQPSYYGGWVPTDGEAPGGKPRKEFPNSKVLDWDESYAEQIRKIGVNWEATQSPHGRSFSEFQGTFCDPGSKEYLTGTLVLNDGTKQKWIADTLVTNALDMMANIDKLQSKFKDLFGEV